MKEPARQKKLNLLQEQHREMTSLKNSKKRDMTNIMSEIAEINKHLKRIGGAIFDLKNLHGDIPHVTDHAVVRYLERVKGLNIWDIKAEIMNSKDAVRIENTIVTINAKEDPARTKS